MTLLFPSPLEGAGDRRRRQALTQKGERESQRHGNTLKGQRLGCEYVHVFEMASPRGLAKVARRGHFVVNDNPEADLRPSFIQTMP